jgi:YegS/Rv2252/BmrU family lipid kinase
LKTGNRHRVTEPGISFDPGDRILVIANPATRRDANRLIAILREMAPDSVDLDIRVTTNPGGARQIADDNLAGARLLIAIGGDGTVADCAHALIETGVPLAVIPGGSTNITAREQGVPVSARSAVDLIFGRHCLRRIDAGLCDDRIFLHMAGAGFDARFFAGTSVALKRKIGWVAYLPAALAAMRHKASRYLIIADDEKIEATSPLVLVANGSSVIHPRLKIHPAIEDDDGFLDLIVITATGPLELARTLGRLGTMQLSKSPFVLHRKIRKLRIESDETIPVEVDGDVFGTTPRMFQVLPGAIRMIVPAVH